MTLTRAMHVLGATTLASALLLASAPGASADQVRDGQWANQYFQLDKVWSVSKGDGVVVAVIDSGVDATHPDLTGQVLPGYDESGQELNTRPTDDHGTAMASLIAGHGHGSGGASGVVGLAPGAKVLPIYKGDASGADAVPQDIKWAVDKGAKVINVSLAGHVGDSPELKEAVAYAAAHDVLIIAGAGNDGASTVASPASAAGVLAVGAVDQNLKVWSGSNTGPEVMLTAPGVDVVSAGPNTGTKYRIGTGTSDATAYVSAAAALVRSKFPELTAGQVANRLVKSAKASAVVGSKVPDQAYGYGVIRPYEALTLDIPAGSKEGPLAAPAGATASTPGGEGSAAPAPAPVQAPVVKSSSKGLYLLGGAAVLVLLVVVVIALAVRGRRRPQPVMPVPPQGQAPYGAPQGYPSAQQPYGVQPPPQGYPQQQPYHNPYQGGGQPPQ